MKVANKLVKKSKQILFLLFVLIYSNPFFAQNLIVIGIDGLNVADLQKTETPHIDKLMQNGSYTLAAQAVLPTKSSPNWASMIMATTPKEHEIKSNGWQRKDVKEKSYCEGKKGETVPTIFKIFRQQNEKVNTACFHQWKDFGRLVEPNVCSEIKHTNTKNKTLKAATSYIETQNFDLLFLHFDHVDHAGHFRGHGSKAYRRAVAKADKIVGKIVKAVEKKGTLSQTTFLLISDHGGKGHGHGGDSPEEVNIPWIWAGAGINSAHQIEQTVNIYDTAASIAHFFDLHTPNCWSGKIINEIFVETK
ncbi:MAG: alkaline phosphatase family protein [Chitinophagales bacterium]